MNELKRIGKRMPYKTPNGFLDDMEQNIRRQTRIVSGEKARRKSLHRRWRIAAWGTAIAASVAVVAVYQLNVQPKEQPTDSMATVEQAFTELSTQDQDYLLQVYQEDIFIDDQNQQSI